MNAKAIGLSLLFWVVMTVLVGFVYPFAMTGVAQLAFPWRANGSLLAVNGKLAGSELFGQYFDDPRYFWSRPSATSPVPYAGQLSAASNKTPAGDELQKAIEDRVKALADSAAAVGADVPAGPVPSDLVTASGSGLDPDISPAAAYYQVDRIAKARGLDPAVLRGLIASRMKGRSLGLLGEPRVNVLELNLALDGQTVTRVASAR